ncbi:MAG TPA: tRNA (adenosine(37)-N6)-threonylcarbamoyltransferase complex dimerization subunit type 1 TsaB [Candidatus Dormibacteraeota bacterium]|nr:tRNA (adenosine(37)-N6)-threonylcarbamoyltransferase complex dimerization subunit type 1 TsaB [Candidatus Dormibacteraeota bacterium]
MILVIDTSSARSAIALLRPDRIVAGEYLGPSGPVFGLPERIAALREGRPLSKVAVATGPGSFTGLRVGVSFGLGLAMGLKVPIVPLPTLAVQAARSQEPALSVSEAGRGRVYHLAPGREAGLAEPHELPKQWPAVGWLRPATQEALVAAGLRMADESRLLSFGSAAALVLETAREVPYDSLRLEYMQSFASRF